MKKVINRNVFICVFTVVVAYTFIFADAVGFTKYMHYNYAGYQCAPEDILFQSENVFEAVTCGRLCFQRKDCLRFSYQQYDNKCIGCRVEIFGALAARSQTIPVSMHFSTADLAEDCSEIKTRNPNATSGIYKIKLWKSKSLLDVYCDMETEGHGWTVFQNRFDGSVDFYRDCEDYENGFGSLTGEFWLGLKYMQEIANNIANRNVLRIDVSRENGDTGFQTLGEFSLVEGSNYLLSEKTRILITPEYISGIEHVSRARAFGEAPFSCKDRDRDEMAVHCAAVSHGAWWHQSCSEININGDYCIPGRVCDDGNGGKTGFYHRGYAGYESLKTSKMMIRTVQ